MCAWCMQSQCSNFVRLLWTYLFSHANLSCFPALLWLHSHLSWNEVVYELLTVSSRRRRYSHNSRKGFGKCSLTSRVFCWKEASQTNIFPEMEPFLYYFDTEKFSCKYIMCLQCIFMPKQYGIPTVAMIHRERNSLIPYVVHYPTYYAPHLSCTATEDQTSNIEI